MTQITTLKSKFSVIYKHVKSVKKWNGLLETKRGSYIFQINQYDKNLL